MSRLFKFQLPKSIPIVATALAALPLVSAAVSQLSNWSSSTPGCEQSAVNGRQAMLRAKSLTWEVGSNSQNAGLVPPKSAPKGGGAWKAGGISSGAPSWPKIV